MYFKDRKGTKRHQGTKIEENQARSRSRKNRTIRFTKSDYPIFFRLYRVRVGFGDFVCFGKIWSYPTQRGMSYWLYKYRSRPIVIYHQHNQSNYYFSYFFTLVFYSFRFSSIRFLSRRHNLQSCRGSRRSTIQTSLGRRRSTSSKPGDAPDCSRSRQNRTIRFLKSDSLVSTVLSRGLKVTILFVWQHISHENCRYCVIQNAFAFLF
jgi:hypothetical protein